MVKEIFGNRSQPYDYYLHSLRAIAAAQAEAGDVAGALEWVAGEELHVAKAWALLGVAEGILKRSMPKCCWGPFDTGGED